MFAPFTILLKIGAYNNDLAKWRKVVDEADIKAQ